MYIYVCTDEVINYIIDSLTEKNEENENIIMLISEKDDNVKFRRILKEYVKEENKDKKIQIRKWKSFLLWELLSDINVDTLQALLQLIEFWVTMGKTDESPMFFPNENDEKSIQKYFTDSTKDLLVKKNYDWLQQEIAKIISIDC